MLSYRYAEMIHDLTVDFVKRYIPYKSRTQDQMEQAGRSGKQNIVEAVSASETSLKTLIYLLGVARASFEELLMDFEDFLRLNNLGIYGKTDARVVKMKEIGYRLSNLGNLRYLGYLVYNNNNEIFTLIYKNNQTGAKR